MRFDAQGSPQRGTPVAAGTPLKRPSGAPQPKRTLPFRSPLKNGDALRGCSYYGHHQFVSPGKDGIHLALCPHPLPTTTPAKTAISVRHLNLKSEPRGVRSNPCSSVMSTGLRARS